MITINTSNILMDTDMRETGASLFDTQEQYIETLLILATELTDYRDMNTSTLCRDEIEILTHRANHYVKEAQGLVEQIALYEEYHRAQQEMEIKGEDYQIIDDTTDYASMDIDELFAL